MADIQQNVLVSLKIDLPTSQEQIKALKAEIDGLKKSVDDVNQGTQESTKVAEQNTEAIKRHEAAVKKNQEAIKAEEGSIAQLRERNKELTKERNNTTTSTEAGRLKIKTLNAELDKNNAKIKENVDAYTKQKIGIGGYQEAIEKALPGMGGMISGFNGMKASAMAFIATPIGAVIGALGLAFAALTAYFKGSEEGQDSLAKAMNIGKVLFEQVTLVVEKLGEVIFKTISFVADLAMKVVEFVAPNVAQALQIATDAANKITELEDSIDARENELTVRRAETAKKVAQLREQALALEGDAKRKVIQEAIDLEKQLAKEETFQAAERLKLLEAQIAASGNATEEQKKERAELTAAKIQAETEEYSSTLRFQKELEKLKDEEIKKQTELNAQRAEELRLKEQLELINQRALEQTNIEIPALDLKIQKTADLGKALDGLKKKNEESTKQTKENAKVAEESSQRQIQAAVALSAAVIGLGQADTKAKKALGLSTIAINSGIGVSEAIKAGAGKPWPLNLAAILSGITAVLTGISQAKGLLGFAQGGLSGTRINSSHGFPVSRSNGDNLLATVKTGEVILNERQQAALGGASTFRAIGVPGFASGGIAGYAETQSALSRGGFNQNIEYLLQNMPRQILVLQDFETVQNTNNEINQRAQIL